MPNNLLAIINNTFLETLRQPVYGVVVGATILLLVLSPSLAMFTLDDDNLLLKDVGISTLLVAGLFLAVFASSTVITDEIENKTVLTVVSKSVSRSVFVLGKFIGVSAAVILAQYLLSLVLMIAVRHGVLETSRDKMDLVVITLSASAAALILIIGLAGNYFYQWRFSSTAIILGTILVTIETTLLAFIDPQWNYNPQENHMHWELVGPIVLVLLATMILTAIAVAVSIRLNLIMSLIVCFLVFVIGSTLEYWLRPIVAESGFASYFAHVALAIIPSINIFVVTNAIYDSAYIPLDYIAQTAIYVFFYVTAILLFAIAFFRTRELG